MSTTEFSKEELERYSRHLIIPDFNINGQRKLKGSKVLVVGTGGLGSPLLLYLTAAGVGTIGILDFDVVEKPLSLVQKSAQKEHYIAIR